MKSKFLLAITALLLAVAFTGASSASAGAYGGMPGTWSGGGGISHLHPTNP